MATPRMDLPAFVGTLLDEDHGDVLREGVHVRAQALMEAEVTELVGAGRYERTDERTAHRTGSRARTWDTRVGTREVAVPKVRPGSDYPSVLQPRRRADQALRAVVQEAYGHGVSTRMVDELVKALGLDGISKSQVSRLCQERDAVVEPFRTRRLPAESPYVWVDATYHKVRIDGRVVSQATAVAVGVPTEGERHVLGVDAGASEDGACWTAVLRSLVKRGLRGVRLGDLGCARGTEARDRQGVQRDGLAPVPGARHAESTRAGAARRPGSRRGDRPDRLRATGPCPRAGAGADGRRGAPPTL